MRITIVQGAFLPVPALRGGAIEKAWDILGREFARRGHEVTHISRLCDGLPEQEKRQGVHHVRIAGYDAPHSALLLKWRDFLYSRRVGSVLPPADIMVTNTFWLPLLARDPSRGKIYAHVGRYPKGQMKFYSRVARLQTVSQAVAGAIRQEAPGLGHRVSVVPYPLPEGALVDKPRPDEARDNVVLYAGRIHPEKGLDLLAEAWLAPPTRAAFAGWKLMLAGPWATEHGGGGENYRAKLAAKLAPAGDTVAWTGPLFGADNGKLHELYQRARIFVYPSVADFGETFGLAPLEAMAAGTPCVVSGLGCFKDFLRDEKNGLVFDHHAPDAGLRLAATLITLAGSPAQRAKLGSAAWQTASNYQVEEVATRYLADFDSVLTIAP